MTLTARDRARTLVRERRGQPPRVLLREALEIYARGDVFLAYEVLRAAPRALESATSAQIERLAAGMEGWAHVDCFGCFAAGVAWRTGRLSDEVIRRWARSPNRWRRRAAVVSTVPLNNRARGAVAPRGEPARTLTICLQLIDDRDDMVVKGMSWALRELAKRNAKAVQTFLAAHRERVAPRVRREVTNKLQTGLKNPRPQG